VQNGLPPDDFKPMKTIGAGVVELRIRDEAGAFRVVYVAKFENAVYVLHCFQKKTPKTSKRVGRHRGHATRGREHEGTFGADDGTEHRYSN